MLSQVAVGGLTFEASAFNFDAGKNSYSASGTVEVGLSPSTPARFAPLLNLTGGFELDDSDPAPTFTVNGSVSEALTGQNVVLYRGNDTFDISQLVNNGLATLDGKSFTVVVRRLHWDTSSLQTQREVPRSSSKAISRSPPWPA
jgi:hypothetical protein